MILLPDTMRVALLVNGARHIAAQRDGLPDPDPVPLLKLFNPCGSATWLATELDEDGDTLFGLSDMGFGCPELGSFSLSEIAEIPLPFELTIERDLYFVTRAPMSRWAQTARNLGSISQAEIALRLTGF
ncbi:DUF2958 domain-containing protein [Novosphingobium sp.]|uniref:DUF2958 domain-containing protein n=1 Tax=Novosphingobium sp. TaxID=1874826 RepID=UPI0031D18CA5